MNFSKFLKTLSYRTPPVAASFFYKAITVMTNLRQSITKTKNRRASRIFRGQGSKLIKKEQSNIKRQRNEHKSYIGDNSLIIRSYKIRSQYDCR